MGRASTRQNKTPYQLAREELGLSRERAAELLETIPAERIERIESERSLPRPDEVLRNTLARERDCLIDISADGSIDPDELADFLRIQRELEQISRTVEALQLWAEKMMADGRIDRAAYTREMSAAGEK